MPVEYLAKHITLFMAVTAIGLVSAIGIPLELVRNRLNEESASASVHLVAERIKALQGQVRMMVQDYNNWGDVFLAAIEGDIDFIADNYGITAINGTIFDGTVMFDGPFKSPIAWETGGERSPSSSFLSPEVLEQIRKGVLSQTMHGRPTYDFLMLRQNRLTFLSASRLLPDTPQAMAAVRPADVAIAVIARSVRPTEMSDISASLNLSELHFSIQPPFDLQFLELAGADGHPIGYLSWLAPRDGDRLFLSISPILGLILIIFAGATVASIVLLRRNAWLLVQREANATRLARIDVLTGLPNRLAFTEHVARLERLNSSAVGIMLIDLNGFKNVNELVGHPGGDEIVRQFAKRIGDLMTENCFVSRLGGDEFVIVLTNPDDASLTAINLAARIVESLQAPFRYGGCSFEISASFGIASRSIEMEAPEELLRRADWAMYQSKRSTGNHVTVYDPQMDSRREADRMIERELRAAIHHPSEFSIVYQPIVNAKTHTIDSVEALARWTSPKLGSVGPDLFIPVAERSGLISVLGDIILARVLSEISVYKELKVCINISPVQLLSPKFVLLACNLVHSFGVSASCVEFELTEGVAVQNVDAVRVQLQKLQECGFSTALDDFGTGFSSIGYLRQMPFSTLKIDRSFVSGLVSRADVESIVDPIICLGHSLGISVTAEGVETSEEADYLEKSGCDRLQGYLFGRPEPLTDLMRKFRFWPSIESCAINRMEPMPRATRSDARIGAKREQASSAAIA